MAGFVFSWNNLLARWVLNPPSSSMQMITKFFLAIVILWSAINGDLAVDDNKLVLNPKKCKCIILPKYYPCDLSLSINDVQVPIVDYLDLLGVTVTINNLLNFSKHIAMITQKIGKQLDVLSRLKNMLSIFLKMCPCNLYIMSYFNYCSATWLKYSESDNKNLKGLMWELQGVSTTNGYLFMVMMTMVWLCPIVDYRTLL